MYTNSQILSAVLNKWLQPVVQQFSAQKMGSFPFVQMIETKLKSTGFVKPSWSLAAGLSPIMQNVSGTIIEPIINRYISQVPDDALPEMAHKIVDDAIKNGGLTLMDGKVVFEKEDMEELKTLLEYNLPLIPREEYIVKTAPDKEADGSDEPQPKSDGISSDTE